MEHTVIYLHPEISIVDIQELAIACGLRLTTDRFGHYLLEPHPSARLPSGARYTKSQRTDVRATIERARAQQNAPDG